LQISEKNSQTSQNPQITATHTIITSPNNQITPRNILNPFVQQLTEFTNGTNKISPISKTSEK
jgi:hypothetical protein